MPYRRRPMTSQEEAKPSIIDTRLPLSWIISSICAVMVVMIGIAVQFNNTSTSMNAKLDTLLGSFAEQKTLNEKRDTKYDLLKENMDKDQRILDAHDLRLTNVERALATPAKGR
jgi:hypothetical protein